MPLSSSDSSPAFLGVDRSVTNRRWQARLFDNRTAQTISRKYDLPDLLGRILAARNIALESIDDFLSPTLRAQLPDPCSLQDMDVAADRLVSAIQQGESLAIFADYDVDGMSSAALLCRFLRWVGCAPHIYIPHRLTEGYGPKPKAMQLLKEKGISLVVAVDCGTVAFEALDIAHQLHLDVIVLDHHRVGDQLPSAVAVVNPHRVDDTSHLEMLCGVGIVLLTLIAVNRLLRQKGWYQGKGEPPLIQWLDLVAMGTVCDIVPLTGINRALVTQGLKIMAQWHNPGLSALATRARITDPPTTYHIGFILGPRLNAAGRVGCCSVAVDLLVTDDAAQATYLANILEANNLKRKKIEAEVLATIRDRLDEHQLTGPVIITGEAWHPGVIGIVAARLLEQVHRPVCVISMSHGIGRGAGRSIKGFDLGSHVSAARQAGFLLEGGGHEMAAGFTIAADRLDAFRSFLHERYQENEPHTLEICQTLDFDGMLGITAATTKLVTMLDILAPFGPSNPHLRFAIADVFIVYARVVGQNHVQLIVSGADGARLKATAFRARGTPLGQALLNNHGQGMHLAGTLRTTTYQGKTRVELIVEDAAYALS